MVFQSHRSTVVVTGASSGIGAQTAIKLAEAGYHLVIHGNRNVRGLQDVAKQCKQFGAEVRCIVSNLEYGSRCESLVRSCFALARSPVSGWVHLAGADVVTPTSKSIGFDDKLERLWNTDVRGTILCCRAAARLLRQNLVSRQSPSDFPRPAIITIGWDQAPDGMEGDAGQYFCPTKAAVVAFTKALAKSVGASIRVNCVSPGWIQTEWGETAPEFWDHRAKSESCSGRWGTSDDIANVVRFLLSKEADFISGQNVMVNGGWKPSWPPSDD